MMPTFEEVDIAKAMKIHLDAYDRERSTSRARPVYLEGIKCLLAALPDVAIEAARLYVQKSASKGWLDL